MSPVVWQDGSDLPDRTGRKERLRPCLFRARWTVLRLLQQPLQQQLLNVFSSPWFLNPIFRTTAVTR